MHNSLLIVDDEPNVLKSLKRLLLDTDYRIFTAESGEEGLKVFEENEINVVISDYRMPGMNGVEFLSDDPESARTRGGVRFDPRRELGHLPA